MVAELAACLAAILAIAAETLHARRCRRVAPLAFGPGNRPSPWASAAPALRVLSLAAMSWALVSLLLFTPKVYRADAAGEKSKRHVLLALDVSPSMRLQDAGPEHDQSRMRRASAVMHSFFNRVPTEQYRISVVAFYTGAKPVVVDTSDMEVVRNILGDLPMHYAFEKGETDIFAGLSEAARTARLWQPRSTTLVVISDGDTVPGKGMPAMPASIADVLVVGVGDSMTGKFIDGRQSRQDANTLRQVALRLGGVYHNANEKHLPSDLLERLTVAARESPFEKLTIREYALFALGTGAFVYAFLPLALHFLGSRWNPGVRVRYNGPGKTAWRPAVSDPAAGIAAPLSSPSIH